MFKKPLIGWLAAALIAGAAGVAGLKSQEVKDIVCAQPVVEAQKPAVVAEPVK